MTAAAADAAVAATVSAPDDDIRAVAADVDAAADVIVNGW